MAQYPDREKHQRGLDALRQFRMIMNRGGLPIATDPEGKYPDNPMVVDAQGNARFGGFKDTAVDASMAVKTPGLNRRNSPTKNYIQNLAHPEYVAKRFPKIAGHVTEGLVGDLGRATWLASGQYQNNPNVFGDASFVGDTARVATKALTDPWGLIQDVGAQEGGLADAFMLSKGARSLAPHVKTGLAKLNDSISFGKYGVIPRRGEFQAQNARVGGGKRDYYYEDPEGSASWLQKIYSGERPAGLTGMDPFGGPKVPMPKGIEMRWAPREYRGREAAEGIPGNPLGADQAFVGTRKAVDALEKAWEPYWNADKRTWHGDKRGGEIGEVTREAAENFHDTLGTAFGYDPLKVGRFKHSLSGRGNKYDFGDKPFEALTEAEFKSLKKALKGRTDELWYSEGGAPLPSGRPMPGPGDTLYGHTRTKPITWTDRLDELKYMYREYAPWWKTPYFKDAP